jgi:hypothetical protein
MSIENQELTLSTLITLAMADVDTKLLRESDQETVKDGLFSPYVIQVQLKQTAYDLLLALQSFGYDINKPLKID